MKSLACSHVWWPELDSELEVREKVCHSCQASKNAPAKTPLHPWAWPTTPWQRIHMDFAGPVMGKMLFVVVDAHSKWPEAVIMNFTTSRQTIPVVRNLFALYGLPEQLVSDNGPQFISDEFQHFLASNGIKHLCCAPYHPPLNEAEERHVQTVKKAVKSGSHGGTPLEQTLSTFLMQYRSTPHATTGTPPSTLFLGSPLRTRLDLLRPNIVARVRAKQVDQKAYCDWRCQLRKLHIGQMVFTRNMREGPNRVPGVVKDQIGPLTYLV